MTPARPGAYIERDGARVAAALERVYALFPILHERRGQRAGTMSGGEQQMTSRRSGCHRNS